jgi:hypothetical protein
LMLAGSSGFAQSGTDIVSSSPLMVTGTLRAIGWLGVASWA